MESLWRRSILLAVDDRLMVGRTQYQVTRIEPALELTVLARAQRRLAEGAARPSIGGGRGALAAADLVVAVRPG
jgi:hypothetical protein